MIIDSETSDKKPLKYGVPQGSKLGPILFTSYIAPISKIGAKYGVMDKKIADDEQLMNVLKPKFLHDQINAVIKMENCIEEMFAWLRKNKLSSNGDKTLFLLMGTLQMLKKLKFDSISIDGVTVKAV